MMKCIQCGTKNTNNALICKKCGDLPENLDQWDTGDIVVPYLLKLYKNIFSKYNKKYGLQDNRFTILELLGQVALWSAMSLKIFKTNYQKHDSEIPVFLKTEKIADDARMPRLIYNLDIFNRISCLTMFLFYTENFFKSVNQLLENKFTGKGYSDLIKHVLKELGLNNDDENYSTLYIPAAMRNTMHEGGIYAENDYNGKINKILFKFKKNDAPPYSSWKHCCFFMENIFLILDKVLDHRKIKKAKFPLKFLENEIDWNAEIKKINKKKK